MKLVFALIATVVAFSAHAGDRKIGNVVAVEREIPNVFESCVANTKHEEGKQQVYFCSIKYTKSSIEVPVSVSGNMNYKENGCLVGAEAGNGKLLIAYGPEKGVMDFDSAKACLTAALDKAGTVKVIVYTME